MFVVFITAVPILAPISIGYYKAVPGGGGGEQWRTRGTTSRGLFVCVCLLLQDLVQSCLRGGGHGSTHAA
jgi:hypothetical protein